MPVAAIQASTLTANRAMSGAAIANDDGRLTLESSTVTGNQAYVPCPDCVDFDPPGRGSAGISSFRGELRLRDVTIADHECAAALSPCEGGLVSSAGPAEITGSNTIIADNDGSDCGAYPSGALSLVVTGSSMDSDSTCPGFIVHGDARLAPLAENGGPTPTRAPLPGSPALDGVDGCFARDQRGLPRARSAADPCDIGAFEVQ